MLPLSRYLRAFYWLPLQIKNKKKQKLVNLGDGSDAGNISHKVHLIISNREQFNSVLLGCLIDVRMWANEVFEKAGCRKDAGFVFLFFFLSEKFLSPT